MAAGWAALGKPGFNPADARLADHPGIQGCFLSPALLWGAILDRNLPVATIFEDDAGCHTDRHRLAQAVFAQSPTAYDVLSMGSMILQPRAGRVVRSAVWCLHASVVVGGGARQRLRARFTTARGAVRGR